MQELITEIEINAPARIVWGLLTNFSRLPEWNPFLQRADGEIRPGEKFKVEAEKLQEVA